MQNQNIQPWAWGQPNAQPFPAAPVFPSAFSPATMENQLMTGYQQMYGPAPSQPPPNYGASQWSAAQIQHWQQWQQWQEKYQQWQAQYGKKYAETIAALGQSPNLVLPTVPAMPGNIKPNDGVVNVGYTTANPPPPPSNAQPVPPPPPEEEKQSSGPSNKKNENQSGVSDVTKENPEELSEAEKTFDIQFKQWEDQFNEWKKQNQDHPDKAQYREYEKKWETWREQLLQRREQMRRKRLSKGMETANDANNSGKKEEPKTKSALEQQASVPNSSTDTERGYANAESQNLQAHISADEDSKLSTAVAAENKSMMLYGNQENQGIFLNQRPIQEANLPIQPLSNANQPINFGGFPNAEGNFKNVQNHQNASRNPGYFEMQTSNFPHQAPFYGHVVLEENDNNIQKFRSHGVENNRGKDFASMGPRFGGLDNSIRSDYMHRRPFGNGNFEDDRNERNFGQRFGSFDNRKPKDFAQDRFIDSRNRDQKFNESGRGSDFGSNPQLNEQAFNQASRNVSERNYSSDVKNTFAQIQNPNKSNLNNSYSKAKVPSLFDITIAKPPGMMSPGKERKPKIWEKSENDKYFDDHNEEKKEETSVIRNEKPWLSNAAWAKNNSPWIKPWELDRILAEKSPDANLRSDAWQKEPLAGVRGDSIKPWASEIEKSELSGYVGNILAKLGNFNVMPPNLPMKDVGYMDEGNFQNSVKVNENLDNKLQSFAQSHNWPNRDSEKSNLNIGLNPKAFSQDSLQNQNNFGLNQGNFVRDRVEESSKFAGQSDSGNVLMTKEGRNPNFSSVPDESVLFGKGDCDERFRFERERASFGISDERSAFRRDDRGCFRNDEERNLNNKNLSNRDEERIFGRGERNAFGRDERLGNRYNFLDDIDERICRNRDRSGRRCFEDRDERLFRGSYDRDDRRNRSFMSPFDRNYGRNFDRGLKEPEWNPQVFDYSAGNSQKGFRSRFPEADDNFKISTVVDYSHGENKQTFDYGHGELKKDNSDIRPFDCGSSIIESPSVIDYGHGTDKESTGLTPWKKENDAKLSERSKSHSRSRSPQIRSRSPKGKPRSRSRSPPSLAKNKRDSNSPTFGSHQPRSRDRFNRQPMKRNRRNSSEDKSSQNTDTEVSKNSFDITTVLVEDLICSPGRETRPNKLVFIMRGLPGSGKTYVTKLIKDKEVEMSGDAPRILSLDDYFMTEVEKEMVDEETGRKVKKKVLEYEYEACAEPHYRGSLLKAFKKTISDGFFSFIIVDSVNEKTKDYEEMWSFAKQKGFQVYVAEMDDDVTICTKRNVHKRTEKEISDIGKVWEKTPNHYLRLDVRSLLQADAITEVEMEVVSDAEDEGAAATEKQKDEEDEKEDEEEDEPGESAFVGSRWDHFENSEQKLDRLDGLKRRREGFHTTMQDYLQLPDDFDVGASESTDGKKNVRWADLEERRQQEKMRAIGFVVGQTDWSRMTDPTFGESALTRTKYI